MYHYHSPSRPSAICGFSIYLRLRLRNSENQVTLLYYSNLTLLPHLLNLLFHLLLLLPLLRLDLGLGQDSGLWTQHSALKKP